MLGQEFLREILAARDVKDVCVELRGRDEPRRDGAYGGHDNVDLLRPELPQRCCTRLLDICMRREAGVGIRLPCRKWRYTTRALGVQLTVEVTDIGGERFDTTVLRGDDDERPPERLPQTCDEQRPRASGESRHHNAGVPPKRIRSDAAEIGYFGNSRDDFLDPFFENFHFLSVPSVPYIARQHAQQCCSSIG